MKNPEDVALDNAGNLYIADAGNNKIRKINIATGVISTFAGTGVAGHFGDGGPATAAQLNNPLCICFNRKGELFITDNQNNCVRKIDTFGVITTYAGNTIFGFSGDGGPATAAQLWLPWGIEADTLDNIFIADNSNFRIRKVDALGIISTIAGTGLAYTYNGENIPATSAQFHPGHLAIDKFRNLYIAEEFYNYRVRKIDTFGIISTVAGTGVPGFSGDGGLATSAQINYPGGLAFDACGNLYVSDINNARIRKVAYPPILTTPAISITGFTSMPVGSTVTVNATIASAGSSYIIHWMNHGIEFTTTTVPVVTYTKMPGIDTITARIVPASYGCYDSTTSTEHYVSTNTTGIYNNYFGELLSLYPNPANTECTITYNGLLSLHAGIAIYDLTGRLMHTYPLTGSSTTISIALLPPGMYVCKIDADGSGAVSKKLVVMR